MIITLGYHCNITFLNKAINIKNKTSVFEYFECHNLQSITDVITKLTSNPKENVIFLFNNCDAIYLLNSNFFSFHYKLDDYISIFQRRYQRFLDYINNEENIYFVRVNPLGCDTTKNEIELFIESIKRINPNNKINFLLIDTIKNNNDIKQITIDINNVLFYHKFFYKKDVNDVYMRESTIIYEYYKKMLEDIGYDTNNNL